MSDARRGERPRRAAGVVACDVRDGLLVYAPDRELAFSLNRSARAVWESCDGRTTEEIAAALSRQVGVGPEVLFDDVAAAVRQLQDLGLLEPAGEVGRQE
jgi:hypothetical protein